MKISNEIYEMYLEAMKEKEDWTFDRIQLAYDSFASSEKIKNPKVALIWDIYFALGGLALNETTSKYFYNRDNGIHDDHIETMIKKVCKTLGFTQVL